MPLIHMKEIFTPLRLLGIKYFKDSDGFIYIKYGNKPRRRIFTS
ncbi:hypothetical protein [Neobacillus sp. D3-1R]